MTEPRIPFSSWKARDRFDRLSEEFRQRVIDTFCFVLQSSGLTDQPRDVDLFFTVVHHPGRYTGCPFERSMKFKFRTRVSRDAAAVEHEIVVDMLRPDASTCVKSLLDASIEFVVRSEQIIRHTLEADDVNDPILVDGAAAPPESRTPCPTDTEGTPECRICMSNRIALMIVPCGHACLCHGCHRDLDARGDRLCPICRAPIESTKTIFLP